MKKKTVLIGVTASIAAYKACEVISRLKKKGFDTIAVMTGKAGHFITPLTLETLTCNKVYVDMFELPEKREAAHIALANRSDLITICPATANIMARLAAGMCDDLLTSTVISSRNPVLIAPAMNENMYTHKITKRNILELKKAGYEFVGPARGSLACGTAGIGHIADPDEIVKKITNILK